MAVLGLQHQMISPKFFMMEMASWEPFRSLISIRHIWNTVGIANSIRIDYVTDVIWRNVIGDQCHCKGYYGCIFGAQRAWSYTIIVKSKSFRCCLHHLDLDFHLKCLLSYYTYLFLLVWVYNCYVGMLTIDLFSFRQFQTLGFTTFIQETVFFFPYKRHVLMTKNSLNKILVAHLKSSFV